MSNQPTPDERAKSIMGSYCGPNTHHWPNGVCNMITNQIQEAIEIEREKLLKIFEHKLQLISLVVRLEANLVDDDSRRTACKELTQEAQKQGLEY